MKNSKTTTNSSTQHERFNYLKIQFHQAPLSKTEFAELQTLAKKFNPKMAKCLEKLAI